MRLWGPDGPGPFQATALSDRPVCIVCHWSGRTLPCSGADLCAYCHAGKEVIVCGYLACAVGAPIHDQAVLRLTPPATDELLRTPQGASGKLRGCVLKLWRASNTRRARNRVSIERERGSKGLAPGWDVLPHVRHSWRLPEYFPLYTSLEEWMKTVPDLPTHPPGEFEPVEDIGFSLPLLPEGGVP